jgi:hypothetical protein
MAVAKRILFVAALHHPDELQNAILATPSGESPPLFPTSAAQHFWERAMRKRGYVMDVFYRNLSGVTDSTQAQRHTQTITPAKLMMALANRVPPTANPDIRLRNRRLVEKARSFQPEILWITGDNRVIYPETLAQIKMTTQCKIIYTCGTSPIVFSHLIERRAAPLYDLVLSNDYYHGIQWLELGAKRMECLPLTACDPAFHHPYPLSAEEQQKYACDIAFVGTLVPNNLYSRRVQALETLREFDLGIWSVHDVPPGLNDFVRGEALGEEMLKILSAAKITINVHGDFMRYGGNMRLFEAAGVGVLQIADDLRGNRQWFAPDETIVTYQTPDELREKVAYYLSHEEERQRISQAAQTHVYANHTYEQRLDRVEGLLEEIE